MASEPQVVVRISARLEEIDLVARLAGSWLSFHRLGVEPRDNFVLAVREAVANAVKHGCALDQARGVEIAFERRNNDAEIRVKDEGGGFDLEALPDPLSPENLLRPSGRGILLMRAYADEVAFDFSGGTRVLLRKSLRGERLGSDEEE